MKLKGLFVVGITILLVFLIYLSTIDTKVYYLTLGDYLVTKEDNKYADKVAEKLATKKKLETYVYEFNKENARVTDITNMIQDNQKTEVDHQDKTLKNALIKSDFVILSIGSNDLFYKLNQKPPVTDELYDMVDEILNDTENLYKLMREYCKEDILVTSFYNPYGKEYQELVDYANQKLQKIAVRYKMIYVNIDQFIEGNAHRIDITLTEKENNHITKEIMNRVDRNLFEKAFADSKK